MSTLRRIGFVASAAAPVMVAAACVDLGTLAEAPADEGGAPNASNEVESGTGSDTRCPPNQKSCGGGCVPDNAIEYGCAAESCARCSVPFADSIICDNGKCAVGTCQSGRGSCDGDKTNGCEADLTIGATCGSCTSACPTDTPYCNAGQCVKDCGALTQCGTQCVDLSSSATSCGTCGNVCPGAANAVGTCVDKKCKIKCNTGFDDCDANPANGCEALQPYYVDADGDGVGGGAMAGQACKAPPGNSLVAGDCLDSNDKVKPGQTTFFATGYTNAKGYSSYDYDCNGIEEREPTKPVGDCTTCRAGDYTSLVRASAPPGADLHCGSYTKISSCSSSSGSSSGCAITSASGLACR